MKAFLFAVSAAVLVVTGCATDGQGGPGNESGSTSGLEESPHDRRIENRISDNQPNPSSAYPNLK